MSFHRALDDIDFHFQFSTLDPNAQNVLKVLMISFYEDLLAAGFESVIHNHPKKLDRDAFIESFWMVNRKLEVCPACDRRRSIKIETKVYDDADHYLPKSKYPFLSLHFANLFPLCKDCNRSIKGNTDPVDDHTDAPLVNIFHPYDRPALEHMDVIVNKNSEGVRFIEFVDKDGMSSRRIQNLKRVFRLHESWIDELRHQVELLHYSITEGPQIWGEEQNQVRTPQKLRKALEGMLERKTGKLGTAAGYILQTSYLTFALQDDDEFAELLVYFMGDLVRNNTEVSR